MPVCFKTIFDKFSLDKFCKKNLFYMVTYYLFPSMQAKISRDLVTMSKSQCSPDMNIGINNWYQVPVAKWENILVIIWWVVLLQLNIPIHL